MYGFGFAPKKDQEGNMDKANNRMWARFVDPDSKDPLVASTLVE